MSRMPGCPKRAPERRPLWKAPRGSAKDRVDDGSATFSLQRVVLHDHPARAQGPDDPVRHVQLPPGQATARELRVRMMVLVPFTDQKAVVHLIDGRAPAGG